MKVNWYNAPHWPPARRFDNGIAWVRVQRKRRLSFGAEGFGLWFSRWFPWVWPLSPWTSVPNWAHDRALSRGGSEQGVDRG